MYNMYLSPSIRSYGRYLMLKATLPLLGEMMEALNIRNSDLGVAYCHANVETIVL